jgi:predicted secreted protein
MAVAAAAECGAERGAKAPIGSRKLAKPCLSQNVMSRGKEMRWLLKDVDSFAGIAHALHTYLGGVALASRYSMELVHRPFESAHGMSFAFDDFLSSDPRGLVAPLVAPILTVNDVGDRFIQGFPISQTVYLRRDSKAEQIHSRLLNAPAHSFALVRKGRFAVLERERCNCTMAYGPEVREAGLWLRERFWQAVRVHEIERDARGTTSQTVGNTTRAESPTVGRSRAPTVVISLHVRRGDVTYFDRH